MIKGSFFRAAVITLGLLAVYRIGNFIPIPGLELGVLNGQGSGRNISINGLGITPWLSALTLVELAAILLPQRFSASFTRNGHARPFSLEVTLLALLFTAVQAGGISQALLAFQGLVIDPGAGFTQKTTAALVVGTALVIALARLIEQYGVGHGFWIMLAVGSIDAMVPNVQNFFLLLNQGALSWPQMLAVLAGDVAIVVAVVALLTARRTAGFTGAGVLLWPLLLAPLVSGWLVVLPAVAGLQIFHWLAPGNPIGFALIAFILNIPIIIGFTFRYAAREGSRALFIPTVAVALGATLLSQPGWISLTMEPLLGYVNAVIVASVLYAVIQTAMSGFTPGLAHANS